MKLFLILLIPIVTWLSMLSNHHTKTISPDIKLTLEATAAALDIKAGDEISIDLVLSTKSEDPVQFQLGSIPQLFGIYLLGPWAPVQPDLTKVRPENWMHQQHSASTTITLTKNEPFRTTVKLSDYFNLSDSKQFRPGNYQINFKFYETTNKMSSPVDSGPVHFRILPKEQ